MSEGQGRGHRRWEALGFGPWGAGDRVKLKGQDQTCSEEATCLGLDGGLRMVETEGERFLSFSPLSPGGWSHTQNPLSWEEGPLIRS